jgi:hypothetical protein
MSTLGVSLRLPRPEQGYDPEAASEINVAIEQADKQNHKRGRDVEIGALGERLILTSSGGTRYQILVSDAGVLSTSAV